MNIKDDRGVTHSGGKKFVRSALAIRDFDRMRMVEKRIVQKARVSTAFWEMLCLFAVSIPFILVGLNSLSQHGFSLSLESNLFQGVFGVLGFLILAAAITRPRTLNRERMKLTRELEMYKAQFQGVCLICEYNLAGLQPESDGCTVCPECGGAWRIQDPES